MSTCADRTTRRFARRAAVLTGVAATVLALAPSAVADPATVGIGVARTDVQQHGSFDVPVWTDAASASISSVTATIEDSGSPVTTITLSQVTPGHWSPAQPLKLTEDGGVMPHLGVYPIDVTATDTAGNTITRTGAGVLDFTLTPQFATAADGTSLTPDPAAITFDHHDVAVHGRLQGVQPGSGDIVALPGAVVTVVRSYDPNDAVRPADVTWSTTTDSAGTFTTPTADQIDEAVYTASYSGAGSTVHGTITVANEFGPTSTPVVITAATDHTTVRPGHRVTIHGTVHRGSAKGAGVAGARVLLEVGGDQGGSQLVVTTDRTGRFSGAVLALGGQYVGWSAATQSPYLDGGYAQGQLTVPAQSRYRGVRITLGSNAQLTAVGEVVGTYPADAEYYDQITRLQWSRNGRTGWRTLATVHGSFGPVTLHAPGTDDGYYRLYHPLSPQLDTAASTPVRLHRTIVRLAHLTTSPTSTTAGHTVTVAGTLQDYRSDRWHAMARRHVELFFLPAGSTRWAYLTSGSTAASGHIALSGKATKTGRWLIKYFGDGTHFDSFAPAAQVTVH